MSAPAPLADCPTPEREVQICQHDGCGQAILWIKRNREWIHSVFGPRDHHPVPSS